jgi:hypothetical protein
MLSLDIPGRGAASHPGSPIPAARTSRGRLRRDAGLLHKYAAALRHEEHGNRAGGLLAEAARRRIASVDLEAVARCLESWAESDWIAVIDVDWDATVRTASTRGISPGPQSRTVRT